MVLTARRLLRFLVLGRSNSVLRLRRVRGRDRCLAGPRRVALGASAGGEKRRIDAARRWSGAAAESNGSDCWAIVRHPNHARLAQLDGNTVAFGPGVADARRLARGGLRARMTITLLAAGGAPAQTQVRSVRLLRPRSR